MATIPKNRMMTADEYMEADLGDGHFELVRGEVVELSPPYSDHGYVCLTLGSLLFIYGKESGWGYGLSNDASVQTQRNPDTVRGPDICFYSEARHPRSKLGPSLLTVAPDVAIEVVSPSNRRSELLQRVAEYLAAGSLAVWLVYPKKRSVAIFRDSQTPPVVLTEGDVIAEQPELPGFRCTVAELFP